VFVLAPETPQLRLTMQLLVTVVWKLHFLSVGIFAFPHRNDTNNDDTWESVAAAALRYYFLLLRQQQTGAS